MSAQTPQESPAQDAPRSHARVRPPFPEGDGLVDVQQIAEYLNICEATWWAWIRAGTAPQGVRLGNKCTRWAARAVRELVARRALEAPASARRRSSKGAMVARQNEGK